MQIWRYALAGGVQRSSLSVKRIVPAFTGAEADAAACPSHGRGICFYRVGDYQIAPIAARSTAMGRWRLTPPGYEGTCLPAGRSVRGSDTPPACHSTPRTSQGEGLRACHSTPRTHQGEGLAPAGGCSKKVHGFPAKLKGRIKESEYAIKQKER